MPKEHILIRELGPREGFQTLAKVYSTDIKLQLIEALAKTGVREIEVASFVRPDKVPQMADAEELVRQLPIVPGVKYLGLYLNHDGFRRAEATGKLSNSAWIYSAASATFLKKNNNRTFDDVLVELPSWLGVFRDSAREPHGIMISTAFGCNYEGEVAPKIVIEQLRRLVKKADEQGSRFSEVSLADTMGWATPTKVKNLVQLVGKEFPQMTISLHLHDTRGTGIANVYAGLEAGIRIFESSVAGVGGCPFAKGAAGNVCTEDLVYLCHSEGFETGINLDHYVDAAKLAEKLLNMNLPGRYFKVQDK